MKTVEPRLIHGERIVRIAENRAYVFADESVHDVSAQLAESGLPAAAVVDRDLKLTGIIVAKELFSILGKPFGRDLLFRKAIGSAASSAVSFLYTEQIREVEPHLVQDFAMDENRYYCLVDERGAFCGIFSVKDMLVYSAEMQKRDMNLAGSIQSRIVPQYTYRRGHSCELASTVVMAQSVGGDYYHVREYEPGKWFFCLCDISGKGIAAAIITAVLEGFLCTADYRAGLAVLVERLNALILHTFSLEKYVTGVFCLYDEPSGCLTYCDMGHGLIYRRKTADGRPVFVPAAASADNMPVGIMEDVPVEVKTMQIARGEVLVLFTDGLSEQTDQKGNAFDLCIVSDCISEAFRARRNTSEGVLRRVKIAVLEAFYQFRADAAQHDDLSLFMLHRFS
ncbi:PP2C family protein-serine/threonine phosphatase [Treponema brennaborense]|uniref:Protein serine/threonine phosphatase n=1 Tax=Treponema brennaborense (strain DSM 12168 / CIP 105900 / DD5/3) TaxID=906968 RepID=F4LPZ0_TREBD|nr:SpoIIE family protein phosphatase [Treponema brennaborense]AEE16082.1 protein serine/threonine phosphatase [Treponema brennaborense DSM 12168]